MCYIDAGRILKHGKGRRMELEVLNKLTATEWKCILETYLYSSKQAATVLEVSVPRIFQLEHTGQLHSVDKGRYLKSEVETIKKGLHTRRKKYRKDEEIITTEMVYTLLFSLYQLSHQPITPKELEEKLNEEISDSEQVIVKYRVANVLRLLLKNDRIIRVSRGFYIPTK